MITQKISDEQIDKIINVTASIDPDGSVWGHDTNIGTVAGIRETIRTILEAEPEKKEEKKTCQKSIGISGNI